jgi:SOS-response transcriptional repressor LexA
MQRKIIPVMPAAPEQDAAPEACESAEPFALMVLGDSMLPEFAEGEIIVVEPEGLARDGSYVVANHDGEPILRQLVNRAGNWWLHPLNARYPDAELAGLEAVRGVVIQKSRPGSRRSRKSYID